jgi:hypothetical protein
LVSAYVFAFENAAADPVAENGLLPEDGHLGQLRFLQE